MYREKGTCRAISNIRHTLVGYNIVDNSDVVVGSALLQLHLHSRLNTWLQYIAQRQLRDETRNIEVSEFDAAYIRDLTVDFRQSGYPC